MKKRGVRDQIGRSYAGIPLLNNADGFFLVVLATKYSTNFVRGPDQPPILANFGGNNTKSMQLSVNRSLQNLQTDYIDVVGLGT
jgi:hypothetical protein